MPKTHTPYLALYGPLHGHCCKSSILTYIIPFHTNNIPLQPERISRKIPGNGPVEDLTSLAIQCNADSAPAKLHAPAAAGSTVTLRWTLWPESHMGPVITYMARCPDTGCQNWTPSASDKVWFKIKEGGREGTSNVWADVSSSSCLFPFPFCISSPLRGQLFLKPRVCS